LTIAGQTTWTAGFMLGTGSTNALGGLTLGAAGANTQLFLSTRTLNNAGAATLAATSVDFGLYLASGATLDNEQGGSFAFATDASIFNNPGAPTGGTFINEGTLNKTGGSASTLKVTVENTGGAVDVNSGTLILQGGGTFSGMST